MLVDRELKEANITIDNLEKHVQELQQKLGKYEEEGEQRKRRSSFFKRDVKKQHSAEVDKYRDLKTAQELASVSLFVTLSKTVVCYISNSLEHSSNFVL